jgi:hypothetical protein
MYQTAQHNIPEGFILDVRRPGNHKVLTIFELAALTESNAYRYVSIRKLNL